MYSAAYLEGFNEAIKALAFFHGFVEVCIEHDIKSSVILAAVVKDAVPAPEEEEISSPIYGSINTSSGELLLVHNNSPPSSFTLEITNAA